MNEILKPILPPANKTEIVSSLNEKNSYLKTNSNVKASPNKSPIKSVSVVKTKTPTTIATIEDKSTEDKSNVSKYEEKSSESASLVKPKFSSTTLSHSLKVGGQGAMNKEQLEKIAVIIFFFKNLQ